MRETQDLDLLHGVDIEAEAKTIPADKLFKYQEMIKQLRAAFTTPQRGPEANLLGQHTNSSNVFFLKQLGIITKNEKNETYFSANGMTDSDLAKRVFVAQRIYNRNLLDQRKSGNVKQRKTRTFKNDNEPAASSNGEMTVPARFNSKSDIAVIPFLLEFPDKRTYRLLFNVNWDRRELDFKGIKEENVIRMSL